jgi:hypothetical protein
MKIYIFWLLSFGWMFNILSYMVPKPIKDVISNKGIRKVLFICSFIPWLTFVILFVKIVVITIMYFLSLLINEYKLLFK